MVPKPVKKPKPPVKVPDDLKAALARDARAKAGFEKLPPSHRREYIEWIIDAKTEPTRERRLATTLEWVAEGKSRNWKCRPGVAPICRGAAAPPIAPCAPHSRGSSGVRCLACPPRQSASATMPLLS